MRVALATLLAALSFGACGRSKPAPPAARDAAPPSPVAPPDAAAAPITGPIVIERVSVHTDVHAVDPQALAASLRDTMIATGEYVGDDHAGLGVRVEVTLAATTRAADKADPAEAVAATEVVLHWASESAAGDEPAPHAHVAVVRPLSAAAARRPDDAIRALAGDVIAQAGRALGARAHERGLPVAGLAPLLASADQQQVTWALELAGARKARALLAAIESLVKQPPPVRDAAITALVAIGDPSAVAAITGAVDFEDRDALATAIEAAIALGGPDADDFLQMIASGHHDADLAARARDGLRRIAKRQPPTAGDAGDAGAP